MTDENHVSIEKQRIAGGTGYIIMGEGVVLYILGRTWATCLCCSNGLTNTSSLNSDRKQNHGKELLAFADCANF